MSSPFTGTMNDDTQFASYSQLYSEAQLYDESQMYGESQQAWEENLPYGDWFPYGPNDYSSMADASELCDSHTLSPYGGSEGGSEASSPASPMSTDSFFTHQTSPTPSLSCLPPYASISTPATSAYSSPDATPGQEVTSPTESPA